jgi:hypothetical protein
MINYRRDVGGVKFCFCARENETTRPFHHGTPLDGMKTYYKKYYSVVKRKTKVLCL